MAVWAQTVSAQSSSLRFFFFFSVKKLKSCFIFRLLKERSWTGITFCFSLEMVPLPHLLSVLVFNGDRLWADRDMFLLRHLWTTYTCMCGVNKTKQKAPPETQDWCQQETWICVLSGPTLFLCPGRPHGASRFTSAGPHSPPCLLTVPLFCFVCLHFILLGLLKTANAQELTGTFTSNLLTLPASLTAVDNRFVPVVSGFGHRHL